MKHCGVTLLLVVSVVVLAAPPYAIHGLHIDHVFSDAVNLAEELGGACQQGTHRRGEVTFARCNFGACAGAAGAHACEDGGPGELTLGVAAVPVLSIALEAPGPSSLLTQVGIVFDGDADAVAQSLTRAYGPPASDSPGEGESWSNSRRVFWRAGDANLTLLKNRRTIMLTTDRVQQSGEQGVP